MSRLQKLADHKTNIVERQSAAAFIASFVARAAFLRHATVVTWFEHLLNWLHAYTTAAKLHEQSGRLGTAPGAGADAEVPGDDTALSIDPVLCIGPLEASLHAVFYSVCQAVLYIFCHRTCSFTEILRTNPEKARHWKLRQLITSPFNPLRYCAEGVVCDFAEKSRKLRLLDCTAVVQTNAKLASLQNMSGESKRAAGVSAERAQGDASSRVINPMERYFPFDPYPLKNSSQFLIDLYLNRGDEEDQELEEEAVPGSTFSSPSLGPTVGLSTSIESLGGDIAAMSVSPY